MAVTPHFKPSKTDKQNDIMYKFPGTLQRLPGKNGALTIILTPEQQDWMRKWYPTTENSRIMAASGMSFSTMQRWKRLLGLSKSPKGMQAIKRRQAQHIKEVCEANGYYDSLRGHDVSPQCRAANDEYQRKRKAGLVLSPIEQVHRDNPQRYHAIMRRKSRRRSHDLRTEYDRRYIYGLPQKHSFHLPRQPYTHQQSSQRHYAYTLGYIIPDARQCDEQDRLFIWYDATTTRRPMLEKKLQANGFTVTAYEE